MQKYQQLEKVGSGNFSTVHLVRNIETGETAAMKVMRTHHKIAIKQAYFLKNFQHPNIVKLLDFEQDPGKGETKLVLEYLPENILQLYEQQQYGLRQQQVKCILFQAALGLAYVHERGIIHRDIKPQNILIDKRKAEIKLIDFGLAISEEKVSTDYVATRWYRAPENLLNTKQYSCLIDVFSLACVIVQLYLGSPLFPGADNIDQLYKIFNILGEPTEEKWPLGYRKFKDMGFKMDPSKAPKKGEEGFGLRNLLKNCSEGLSSLLEKMLTLCPKSRIKCKQILHDPYFGDVKTIIPPTIYKRYQKDHILKKTLERNQNKNEGFSNPSNIKPKLQRNNDQRDELSMISSPSKLQINNTNCGLINLALSPMKNHLNEGSYLRQKENQLNSFSSRPQATVRQYQQTSQPQGQNTLTFRGFNPIKNNKVSIKQTRKQIENHSNNKYPQKDSRNNSIDSSKSKGQMISNSIDLGKKLLNYSGKMEQIVKVERRLTNQRDYRTPDIKNKSLDKGKVIYYFQGDKNRVSPSPQKIIMPAMNIPIQNSLRLQTKHQPQKSFIPIDSSIRVTRNNSAINIPARAAPADFRTFVKPRSKQRISHSPGISATQVPYSRFARIQTKPQQAKETIYTSPTYDKLKFITNQTSPHQLQHHYQHINHYPQRVDLSQESSLLHLTNLNTPQVSILHQEKSQKGIQFKQRANPSSKPVNQPTEAFRHHLLDQKYNKQQKPKQFKSVQPRQMAEASKYFQNKKDSFSIAQLKNIQIDDRRDYRQPRISAKKIDNNNRKNSGQTLSQLLSSPRQNNISINLNVSIIEGQNKHDMNFSKQKRSRF